MIQISTSSVLKITLLVQPKFNIPFYWLVVSAGLCTWCCFETSDRYFTMHVKMLRIKWTRTLNQWTQLINQSFIKYHEPDPLVGIFFFSEIVWHQHAILAYYFTSPNIPWNRNASKENRTTFLCPLWMNLDHLLLLLSVMHLK